MIGNLPLSLSSSLSPLRIRQISVYGVGLLVGAALTIIIPEGVDAVYSSGEGSRTAGHGHARLGKRHEGDDESKSPLVGAALVTGFLLMSVPFSGRSTGCQS